MKKVYEAWEEEDVRTGTWGAMTLGTVESIQEQRTKGLLAPNAKLRYRFEADTLEEALAVHHIKMGWSTFQPAGKPAPCPNACGGFFYPEGSGECPNCGKIC
jgi:hypothetical protein